ncbi:hypothetical protein F441_09851 [Phytophthora nicotianae CJ01A1]|uniref:Uncharacterized protein n=4 Tax=Phytophthora nicotianae TaxID=4792 RepID=W2R8S4_PHYN3|nr:hypothetical protein PPTG_01407 [Phytophthora nicotianae INRA-310]ETK85516.1 hypothetical protein L915_09700 [Phytophthora nicotianae]ETN21124.1 hypothetical protein PPTG_01407 [Phytophthora nicotianae INRA-310]ETP15357.1 hypothetical protein F441_09851 [Phytophthora nicotianae CJ01A1]ETP43443.1 hypothetical protein F442_09807 [Phytophthora nicotianae P10297]
MNGGVGDAALQHKRAAGESEEERMAKQMRTDAGSAMGMAQANAQAMFGSPQQQSNLFFMGSQPMVPPIPVQQPMTSMAPNVPQSQAQHIQMQIQQRQQQQQYAVAMAARRNAQQQQQAAAMAAMMGQQGAPAVHQSPQMNANPGTNIHVASLMGNQGANFQANAPSGIPTQPQLQQEVRADNSATTPSAAQVAPATANNTEEPCVVCGKKGDVFTCNGGCGLHAHPACIGEEAIFPFVVGQLCGSCFIVQQNRASPEDLTKGGPHALSVRRAILCVNLETNSNSNFDKFGHLASLRLGEIGSIAGYPIKPFAEKFVEPYLQRWIREKLATAGKWMLNVREIFTVMIGLYSLKRACIAHGLHDKVIELMKARKFTVMDFFGWHPAIEGPNVRCSSLCAICGIRNAPELDMCSRCHHKLVFPSVFTKYISTLLAAFYAEQVGIPLGASTLDVFAHTNTVRGLYKGLQPFDADGVTWDMFTDQLRMIFGFLDIMSNFGTLQLNPDLFVPEMNIIFNPAYVNQAMIANEFEVVGKFLQCMRLFGHAKSKEKENMIESCERYLLFKHLPNGSWCKMNGSTVDQYKATVTCSKALLTPTFRGYGPISHDFQRLLEKWARNAAPKLPSVAMAGRQPADTNKLKLLASGATVKTNTQTRLKRLEAMYKRQTAPKGGNSSLECLMTDRMKKLLKAKKLDAQSKTAAEGKAAQKEIKVDADSIKEEAHPVETKIPLENDETMIKKEEGTTDSEDVKSEHQDESSSAGKDRDDDDMLTSMSLHEDLEIFDGLQFEDGGGIIDMNFPSLGPQGDTDDHAIEDADGTDAPGQDDDDDETMDEHVVDDDEDENEDTDNKAAGEVPQQEIQEASTEEEKVEIAGSGDATIDFLEM